MRQAASRQAEDQFGLCASRNFKFNFSYECIDFRFTAKGATVYAIGMACPPKQGVATTR